MHGTKSRFAGWVACAMALGVVLPGAASASSKGRRNTAIGLGAVAVYGAATRKPVVAGAAAAGAIYSLIQGRREASEERDEDRFGRFGRNGGSSRYDDYSRIDNRYSGVNSRYNGVDSRYSRGSSDHCDNQYDNRAYGNSDFRYDRSSRDRYSDFDNVRFEKSRGPGYYARGRGSDRFDNDDCNNGRNSGRGRGNRR